MQMSQATTRLSTAVSALVVAVCLLLAGPVVAEEPTLPADNADEAQTSISGISSGAFMAVQFATAWSSIVIGVGAVAGGPFGCSEGFASAALSTCMGGQPPPDLSTYIGRADAWSKRGAIDDVANIARQRIYLFNGYNDLVVARPVGNTLRAFYAHYLGPGRLGNLFYQTAIGAGHSQVTLAYGGACASNGGEYINKCGYDQAGIILRHIYGALAPRNDGNLGGRVITFGQGDFTGSRKPLDDSLDDAGFAYVPAACEARAPCRVHVALHGCLQSFGDIGEDFVLHAGYNEWADGNRIIVLYPQIKAVTVTALGITNPQSCWDWWGYLDANPTEQPSYLLKSGKQISAIKAMVDRITSGAVAPPAPAVVQLAPPATVLAVDASDSAIDVVWSAVPGAASYQVFRAEASSDAFEMIGLVAGLGYGNSGLKPATAYRYQVRVVGSGGSSDPSAIVSQQTRRKVPPCAEPGICAVR